MQVKFNKSRHKVYINIQLCSDWDVTDNFHNLKLRWDMRISTDNEVRRLTHRSNVYWLSARNR